MTIWFIVAAIGSSVFGVGKSNLLQGLETFAQKQLIIVLPFVMIIMFHKLIWLIYYIKYYWVDKRGKDDERVGINKEGNKNSQNPNLGHRV